jgi:predicted nucleotidyltransferase
MDLIGEPLRIILPEGMQKVRVTQPERLSNSVKVRFLDAPRIINELRAISKDIMKRDQNVLGIYLFGSLSKRNYSPRSDGDILIILGTDTRRFMDRIPYFLRFFLNAPIPIDVFPYTEEEMREMVSEGNLFITRIQHEGIPLT